MIKELVHDPIFLAQKSENATIDDKQVAIDLLDTLVAHKKICRDCLSWCGMEHHLKSIQKQTTEEDRLIL